MSGAESGAGSAAGSEAGSAAESGQRVRQNLHRMVNRNYGKPVLSGLIEILIEPVFCFRGESLLVKVSLCRLNPVQVISGLACIRHKRYLSQNAQKISRRIVHKGKYA